MLKDGNAGVELEREERPCNDQLQDEQEHEESDVDPADRWNHPANRREYGLDYRGQIVDPASAPEIGNPRYDRIDDEKDRVDVDRAIQELRKVADEQIHVGAVLRRRGASPLDRFEFFGRRVDRRLESGNRFPEGARVGTRVDAG